MINILFRKENIFKEIDGKLKWHQKYTIKFEGHAYYAVKGQDIVCASVSTIQYLLDIYLDYKKLEVYKPSEDEYEIYGDDPFLESMAEYLSILEKSYPNNVRFIYSNSSVFPGKENE